MMTPVSVVMFFFLIAAALVVWLYARKLKKQNAEAHEQIFELRKEIRITRRASLKNFNEFKLNLLKKRNQPIVTVLFLPVYEEIVLWPQRKSLMMHAHENGIGVPSACLGISQCGTCKVKIMTGPENVLPRANIEKGVMEMYDLDPSVRFTCMMRPTGDMIVQIYPEQKLFDTVGTFPSASEMEEDAATFGIKCVEQIYQ